MNELELYDYDYVIGDEYPEGEYPDEDYPEGEIYEDWDNLEMGFDPYMGCYSDDC